MLAFLITFVLACAPVDIADLQDTWWQLDGELAGGVTEGCPECQECVRLSTYGTVDRHGLDRSGVGHSEHYAESWAVVSDGRPLVVRVVDTDDRRDETWEVYANGDQALEVLVGDHSFRLDGACLHW